MVLNSYYFLETGPQNLKLNLIPCPKYKDLPLLSSLFFFMSKWLAILLYLYLYLGFYFYFLKISLKKALLEPFTQQGTVLYQEASFSLEASLPDCCHQEIVPPFFLSVWKKVLQESQQKGCSNIALLYLKHHSS